MLYKHLGQGPVNGKQEEGKVKDYSKTIVWQQISWMQIVCVNFVNFTQTIAANLNDKFTLDIRFAIVTGRQWF